ncbi:MAG: PHP domain-containing protein [Acidobacteria bacterium]|nr:PHP domain-containing protein [Acidobacteriota bacterium]
MRCDLHVHTIASGMCTVPVARRFCRECYSAPLEVYERLKSLGMDLVTVTDHDSIDAVEQLRRFDDFFVSEEVSIHLPSGTGAHIAVYDLNDRQHIELQQRRTDLPSLLAYLREQELLYGVNHVFSGLTGRRAACDFDWFEQHFPLWESLNGAMLECANRYSAAAAQSLGKGITAGSDAHTMETVGSVYTEVSGARDKATFLEGLRRGEGRAVGASGDAVRVMGEVWGITRRMFAEKPWTLAVAPLLLALPAVALGNQMKEAVFARYWFHRLGEERGWMNASWRLPSASLREPPPGRNERKPSRTVTQSRSTGDPDFALCVVFEEGLRPLFTEVAVQMLPSCLEEIDNDESIERVLERKQSDLFVTTNRAR